MRGASTMDTFWPSRVRWSSKADRCIRGAFFTGSPVDVLKLFLSLLGIHSRKPNATLKTRMIGGTQ